ncbi:MAG: hypothetical protein M3P39_05665 [Actinomycetota bacterium]|nr:hypothetical protein [Actinomycetota bacterium]
MTRPARRPTRLLALTALPALVAALAFGGVAPGAAAAKAKTDDAKTAKTDEQAGVVSGRKVH